MFRRITNLYPFMTPRANILRYLPSVPSNGRPFRSRNGTIAGYHAGRDHISLSLYWFGAFDPWVDGTLQKLALPGETALDIGANIGSTTLSLAKAVGPKGKVIAFEPHPGNLELLHSNLSANKLSMVEVQKIAVSDQDGYLNLAEPSGQPGMSQVTVGAKSDSIQVPSQRLDGWLEARPDLGPVSVCKIDVEGHESSAFAGMERALASGQIASFLFEHHVRVPAPADPLFDLLKAHRYQVYRIEKSPLRIRYVAPHLPPVARPTSDFVALHADADAAHRLGL